MTWWHWMYTGTLLVIAIVIVARDLQLSERSDGWKMMSIRCCAS